MVLEYGCDNGERTKEKRFLLMDRKNVIMKDCYTDNHL